MTNPKSLTKKISVDELTSSATAGAFLSVDRVAFEGVVALIFLEMELSLSFSESKPSSELLLGDDLADVEASEGSETTTAKLLYTVFRVFT